MPAGLFDTAGQEPLDSTNGQDAEGSYRAVAGTAIAAAVTAALSPLAFFDWSLAVVPAVGIVLGAMAYRTIAQRPDVFIGRPLAIGAIVLSAVSLVAGLITLSRAYAAELPDGYERLNYGLLQPLPGDPSDAVPDTARTMDGRNVLLKGYIYPGKQQTGITQFLLVRDQGDCCFGGNPKITDRVLVQLKDPSHPKGIDFSSRLTKIAGRFVIRPMGAPGMDGGVLYHLEDAFAR
ncbi:MAG: DUF4190 domain-containing protein [Planctomycetia bacterium]|nr:DUF4190 domain-containing protein [Planctomycetia bacterium]